MTKSLELTAYKHEFIFVDKIALNLALAILKHERVHANAINAVNAKNYYYILYRNEPNDPDLFCYTKDWNSCRLITTHNSSKNIIRYEALKKRINTLIESNKDQLIKTMLIAK